MISTVCLVMLNVALPAAAQAQTTYKLATDANMKVLGTSNVHDWVMTSTAMESQGDFKIEDNQLRALNSLTFSLLAKSLKSEHESMDERTYKTMKAGEFPRITYKLTSAVVSPLQKNTYSLKTTGDLTIAGVTQAITMTVTASVNADNTVTCTGSQKIRLTDYRIDPPSFMLGAMKVKNDLTIQFSLVYKPNQLLTKNQ